jgi:hypothetical protein
MPLRDLVSGGIKFGTRDKSGQLDTPAAFPSLVSHLATKAEPGCTLENRKNPFSAGNLVFTY